MSRLQERQLCAWCKQPVPEQARRDSRFCGKRCRQASWRFGVAGSRAAFADRPMRFGYADPPYPGKAVYYPERSEVDHAALVAQLVRDFPDGWALSTSGEALLGVWNVCPAGTRLAVWVKAPRRGRSARPLQAFEALLVYGGRPLPIAEVQAIEDALVYRGRFNAFPGALIGMKPPPFSVWMFQQLGARPGDDLVDMFPGSGAVSLAWRRWSTRDASPQYSRDAFQAASGDASALSPGDASQPGGNDASPAADRDMSTPARSDASEDQWQSSP